MKFNICILCMAIVYTGFCLAAEAQVVVVPAAQIVRPRSPVFQAPESTAIMFPNKKAMIVIYSEKIEVGMRILDYLENDPALISQIEQALNATIVGSYYNSSWDNLESWKRIRVNGREECILIAFGEAAKHVLVYLASLGFPSAINSVILIDPEIPGKLFGFYDAQLIPEYKYISNRVYNFYSRYWSKRQWRKIYPNQNGVPPVQLDGQYYFKGINIFTQVIDKNGKIFEQFNFETMNKDSFRMILETIAKTNKYRLQPDLKAIIKNYSTEATRSKALFPLRKVDADLPIVAINKPLVFKENPPTLRSEVVHIDYKVGNVIGAPDQYYECQITPELVNQLKPIIENEQALSSYTMQMHGINQAKVEEKLREYKLVQDNPYMPGKMEVKNETVDMVSTDIKVYRLEHDYIEKRKHDIILPALQQLCPGATRTINIAIVASGGGSRAMFATYGALKGLNDLKGLDATSYICGLSGSTWAISSVFMQANTGKGMSVTAALTAASRGSAQQAYDFGFLTEAIAKAPLHLFSSYPTTLYIKSLFNQPITNTDWYGNSIAEKLLGRGSDIGKDFYVPYYLSHQLGTKAQWIKKDFELPEDYNPKLPFPIYTAVTPLYNTPARMFPWFEFTPYQIGAVIGSADRQTGMFVKTWAFGREFEGGHSRDFAPEQALEFYLGVFGSALNCTLNEALAMVPDQCGPLNLKPLIEGGKPFVSWIPRTGLIDMDYRPRFAEVFNPTYKMTDVKFSDYSANKTIGLIDAGFAFNLPFPPLNDYNNQRPERKPDVIIFIDASADAKNVNDVDTGEKIKQAWPNGETLRLVECYARENTVPFPLLPTGNLASATCSIFDRKFENEEHWPLVIYLPVAKNKTEINAEATFNGINIMQKVKNDNLVSELEPTDLAAIELGNYATQNTGLSTQEAINLMALMQYNVLNNGDLIKRKICDRVREAAARPAQ